ncbi:hypothetical protein Ptr86124_002820 [Pyrenophora tritici-repentis]|uniref:Uncharacterized protein n=1 Tax=Pyrenophora tritici-repentis TaxID=45151 RepID=A0A922NGN2_9PLEO|nr:hypothetical protein Ptr86124_002820 [Pyrenophora tritici-repentis]
MSAPQVREPGMPFSDWGYRRLASSSVLQCQIMAGRRLLDPQDTCVSNANNCAVPTESETPKLWELQRRAACARTEFQRARATGTTARPCLRMDHVDRLREQGAEESMKRSATSCTGRESGTDLAAQRTEGLNGSALAFGPIAMSHTVLSDTREQGTEDIVKLSRATKRMLVKAIMP